MPRRLAFLAAAALGAVLAAGAADAQPTAQGQIAKGRALVVRNCGMCHAVGRTGASPNKQAPPFRELHQRYDMDMLGEALAEGILTGHPAMPEYRFQPDEVVAIIRYLRSIQDKQTVALPAAPGA
jgi:mono/diheme cytochrome c family protein